MLLEDDGLEVSQKKEIRRGGRGADPSTRSGGTLGARVKKTAIREGPAGGDGPAH